MPPADSPFRFRREATGEKKRKKKNGGILRNRKNGREKPGAFCRPRRRPRRRPRCRPRRRPRRRPRFVDRPSLASGGEAAPAPSVRRPPPRGVPRGAALGARGRHGASPRGGRGRPGAAWGGERPAGPRDRVPPGQTAHVTRSRPAGSRSRPVQRGGRSRPAALGPGPGGGRVLLAPPAGPGPGQPRPPPPPRARAPRAAPFAPRAGPARDPAAARTFLARARGGRALLGAPACALGETSG